VTTATHSLDTTSGATTVAELLARNGARVGRAPHRRSRAASPDGQFDGTLPAFAPVDHTAAQYRYDKTTVAALLEDEPAVELPHAEENRPGRAGLKIAGLAFAGAVLVGGWALANAQAPDNTPGGTASGPVPSNNTPESVNPLLASAPVGAQVVTLASVAPTGTAEIPAPAVKQPDQGKFSGTLPKTTTKAKAGAPTKTSTPAPPQITAPKLPAGTYTWPVNPYDYTKNWSGAGAHHKPHR
jgi:hypothetical protein